MEPFVVRRSQDDNHPGRLIDSDQHCDHPSLWMEQLHLRRRPQAQVPLLTCAQKHYGLSEVNHLMITLDTSTSLWTFDDITFCISKSLYYTCKEMFNKTEVTHHRHAKQTQNHVCFLGMQLRLLPVLSVLKPFLFESLLQSKTM